MIAASQSIRDSLAAAARTRALQFFFIVWAVAAVFMVARGKLDPFMVIYALALFALSGVTVLITQTAPPPEAPAPPERRRLWLQVAFLLAIIVMTGIGGLVFHNVVYWRVPIWADMIDMVEQFAVTIGIPNPNYLSNPVTYFLVPLAGLLLLGARWRTLGFEPGHRVLRVLLLWCSIPVLLIVFIVLSGVAPLSGVAQAIISNSLQNGFFEEFLMRGALQTRLSRLLSPLWALAISSLIFGIWHLGLGFTNTGGESLIEALAVTVASQAAFGLAFGVIFARTRNLLAPSVVHVALNVVGRYLG